MNISSDFRMVSLGGVFHTVPLLNYSSGVMEVVLNEVFVSIRQLSLSSHLISHFQRPDVPL